MTSPGSQPRYAPPPDADPLACEISREQDTATVRAVGVLDIATVPVLDTHVAELRKAGARRVILDLRDVWFIDSTGLRCLLECDAEARQDGFHLALIQGPPAVQRVFELTGAAARLSFIDP